MTETSPRRHRDKTETSPNTETSPKPDRDKTETSLRQDRDMTETSPRQDRDILGEFFSGAWAAPGRLIHVRPQAYRYWGKKCESTIQWEENFQHMMLYFWGKTTEQACVFYRNQNKISKKLAIPKFPPS